MQFTDVFGTSPRVKLLDFLADHIDFDYTISQLHEFSGISRPTLYDLLEELIEEGMVLRTRTVGDSAFFKLDTDSPKVVALLSADFRKVNETLLSGGYEDEANADSHEVARYSVVRRASAPSYDWSMSPRVGPQMTLAAGAKKAKKGSSYKGGARRKKASPKRSRHRGRANR